MKVLFASAEAYPLAKVGGLGDVAGSLPKALRALGHDMRVVLPKYRIVRDVKEDLGPFSVGIGGGTREARLRTSSIDGVPVYLIDHPPMFDRPKVYEYGDDGKRFGFFGRAILDMLPAAEWWPDVIHLNDWHSALAAAYLKTTHAGDARYRQMRSVLTIHNLLHQGVFGRDLFEWTGLPAEAWNPEGVEFYGQLNFLKAGIVYADRVNTVSPTYAKEIQTAEYGEKLDGLLRSRAAKLSGILNGIDYAVWNPAKDKHLAQTYTKTPVEKKAKNKAALQREVGLAADPKAPLIGIVGRVTAQKGFDILTPALPDILDMGAQVVLLGTGEKKYEEPLAALAKENPSFVAALKYDEALAHRIYAGSDFFLMPSRFEPCGLGQIISLRYGTVPIVRATGGLADTVTDVTADPKAGNGFVFAEYTTEAFLDAAKRGLEFHRKGRGWKALQQRGMAADLSWKASAKAYADLYGRALASLGLLLGGGTGTARSSASTFRRRATISWSFALSSCSRCPSCWSFSRRRDRSSTECAHSS
ncbi:MAG: glycogen synthase GlgA, partial [Candidatus Thermoplasmatota archaeon]